MKGEKITIRMYRQRFKRGFKRVHAVLARALESLRTLRWKLFLSYMMISIIPMFLLWWIISDNITGHLADERMLELRSAASQIAILLDSSDYMFEAIVRPAQDINMNNMSASLGAGIIVTNDMAIVLFDSHSVETGNMIARTGIIQALDGTNHDYISGDRTIAQSTVPVTNAYGAVIGAVEITGRVGDAGGIIRHITSQTLNLIGILGILVAVLIMIIARWLLKPMRRILDSMKRISEGHLEERIVVTGRGEFEVLATAVNDMTSKLEKVETARQEFVSDVSHELKTPLSSIKVLSESLLHQEDVAPAVYREFLGDITGEVDRMASIINELLTLVRLDEVELPLNVSSFSLNRLLEDVIKRLKPLADQKGISIDFAEIRQVNVEADEMKLNLAFSNLVENAIKYNDNGGHVKVTVDADNKSTFVSVADNGVGISEENQKMIFDRFFRVDKGRDRENGGTGLGLAITRKSILLHKGSIRIVSSKENEGSTFMVRIPLSFS